jgi:hypothetical protein
MPSAKVYQLRIELQEIKPLIWRRVRIPGPVKLAKVHRIFQIVMGWTDTHLHEFAIGATHYGTPDPDFDDEPIMRDSRVTLAEVLTPSISHFIYSYDFGDGWEHVVHVEPSASLKPEEPALLCLAGENACPPEDVGGPYGYADFLRIIRNPKAKEHRTTLQWCGGAFDPTGFDLQAVNHQLRRLKV